MKKQQSFFSLVFAIYLIAGIAAIVLFYQQGSHLSHTLDQPDPVAQEADPKAMQQTSPDVEVVEIIEPTDSEVVEDNDATDSEIVEDNDTTDSEVIEDNDTTETDIVETNEDPQVISDAAIEADDVSDPEETNASTDEALPDDNEAKTYYGYTVNSDVHALRVRKTSERNSKIIAFINGGETGFVIEKGDVRSQILTPDGTVGYVFNEYITISEIPKKEVPKEYR